LTDCALPLENMLAYLFPCPKISL